MVPAMMSAEMESAHFSGRLLTGQTTSIHSHTQHVSPPRWLCAELSRHVSCLL